KTPATTPNQCVFEPVRAPMSGTSPQTASANPTATGSSRARFDQRRLVSRRRLNTAEGYVGCMRRELPGGFEVDDDPARIDLDATDAHGLYRKFGFTEPSVKVLERGG